MAQIEVNPSDLRTRITFQTPTLTKDAGGAQVVSWANISTTPTVWARWITAHGDAAVQASALQSAQRATVLIRYRADVVPIWQVVKDNEAWQIISVDMVQDRNRWVEMVVERVKGTV